MKKLALSGIVAVGIAVATISAIVILQSKPRVSDTPVVTSGNELKSDAPVEASATKADGRYADYSSASLDAAGYDTTIIFFHASWCPECRGFEKAIQANSIPDGVQILKADYDSSQELRQKYGVTIQSTFVRIDATGAKLASWTGYGKDKSIDAIIENTR